MPTPKRSDADDCRPGPKPETFKVEGMDWEEAMKPALQVKRPPEGWPEEVKKPRKPKESGK
jgi:hypothetical protein